MANIYKQSRFFDFNEEIGIYDYIGSDFIKELKLLPIESRVNVNNRILDEIAFDEMDNVDLWWIIGLFNDIQDPLNIIPAQIAIPLSSKVATLALKYIEKKL